MRDIRLDTPFGPLGGLRFGDGSGTPVLALHGWLDNAASFVPIAPYLPGLDLVALDLPGHGASAHLPAAAEYTMVSAARSVLAAADALGWNRFAVLGHSMGAAIATLVAAAAPARITRLALIEALGGLTEAEDHTAQRLRDAFAADARPAGTRRRAFPDIDTAVRARLQAGGLSEVAARLIVTRGLARAAGSANAACNVRDAQRATVTESSRSRSHSAGIDHQGEIGIGSDVGFGAGLDGAAGTNVEIGAYIVDTASPAVDESATWSWRSDPRLTRPTAIRLSEAQMRDVIASVECPVRLINAEPAFRYFPEQARTARAALLRDVQVIGIDGGHHLHMERPDVVAAAIAAFLRGE